MRVNWSEEEEWENRFRWLEDVGRGSMGGEG